MWGVLPLFWRGRGGVGEGKELTSSLAGGTEANTYRMLMTAGCGRGCGIRGIAAPPGTSLPVFFIVGGTHGKGKWTYTPGGSTP